MNDKCSAGTGRFFEAMANAFEMSLPEFSNLSLSAKNVIPITAQCTVFAESEVISHIGAGERREDIAAGVVDSVVNKVSGLCQRHGVKGQLFLTGGLCDSAYLVRRLSEKLGSPVGTHPMGRYAGALGAALIARGRKAAN